MSGKAIKPHYVGEYPAWDIQFDNGEIHKNITRIEIRRALVKLEKMGIISVYDTHIDVVRDKDIKNYVRFYEMENKND